MLSTVLHGLNVLNCTAIESRDLLSQVELKLELSF